MCGVVGIVENGAFAIARAEFDRALAAIRHRGPDADGVWNEGAATLGHRRLSIVDLSPAGAQPMLSDNGRYVLSFNGEIYNHAALRAELDRSHARTWRGHSDTEVLLALIEQRGIEAALAQANGMFAFALWDRHERRLFLARDRFGEKPLYYVFKNGGCAFASELTALEEMKSLQLRISTESLAHYFLRGYVPAPHSIYDGVSKLPPGTLLSWRAGEAPRITRYWSAEAELGPAHERGPRAMADAADELRTLLQNSVRERMMADVPVGVFLSGGVDSSLIAAAMQKCAGAAVTTLTLGFDDPAFNEADHARVIAEHLGTRHIEEVATADDALAVVAKLGRMYDEPLADPSQIPTYLICEMARRHVSVVLTGDGGDELFAGYRRHFATPQLWRRMRMLPMRQAAPHLIEATPAPMLEFGAGFMKGFAERYGAGGGVGQSLKRIGPWFSADSLIDLHERSLEKWPRDEQIVLGETAEWEGARPLYGADVDQLCLHDLQNYLPGDILAKVDRASMAVSLETRIPFLDPALLRFAMSLPVELRLDGAKGKLVLREALKRDVPEALFDRRKTGFAPPLEAWLRGPLRGWAEDLMSPEALAKHGLLDAPRVRRFWERYLKGGTMQDQRAWAVLQFQSWYAARH